VVKQIARNTLDFKRSLDDVNELLLDVIGMTEADEVFRRSLKHIFTRFKCDCFIKRKGGTIYMLIRPSIPENFSIIGKKLGIAHHPEFKAIDKLFRQGKYLIFYHNNHETKNNDN